MNILIRADSSSTIGLGHIMRDLVLAEHYPDDSILFSCRDLPGNIINRIPHRVRILSTNEPQELIDLIRAEKIDRVIFDHYAIDADFEKQIKEATGVTILSLDDTYQKHHCDILLNHNVSADPSRYAGLVPEDCELRCGGQYTLIRDEFKVEKQIKREKLYDIFIAMGGTDPTNATLRILETLSDDRTVCVATTSGNPHLDELKTFVRGKKNVMLEVDSNRIAQLLNQSRLAIITPSVMVHEVLFMQIPFITIKTASNQDEMYTFLKKKGYYVLQEFDTSALYANIEKILKSNPNTMRTLFIITGTTKGLGKAFFEVLYTNNKIMTINRNKIMYSNNEHVNIEIDLSKTTQNDLKKFEKTLSKMLTKNIEKIVFINNAFTMGALGKIDELDNNKIIKNINTNFVSSFLLIKLFLKTTKNLPIEKKILNISSGAAHHAIDGWSIYCTTKSAMEMLINNINLEYSDFKCFNIDPGVMNTQMQLDIRNFENDKNNNYFIDLHKNNELKDPLTVAKYITKKYI